MEGRYNKSMRRMTVPAGFSLTGSDIAKKELIFRQRYDSILFSYMLSHYCILKFRIHTSSECDILVKELIHG